MESQESAARPPSVARPDPAGTSTGTAEPPLRIYTLGRFSLVRDGTPLRYTRKAPSKPLLLLKALIASGGRQVGISNLAGTLWPDKDGDLAHQSFETTLHRLRKHLGDDTYLLLEDGRLTLNSAKVWVDAWEFERHLGELRAHMLRRDHDTAAERHFDALASRVLAMYQGHFLVRDDATCWSVSMQERLRSKYVHGLLDIGRYQESRGRPEAAIRCYRKGIEVDDLIETFYQRLMQCLLECGRIPEAIATYRQCRHVLSIVLGLEPTAQTRRIYQDLLARHARRA
jgi:DNA-binding SARP family transcriptional activator